MPRRHAPAVGLPALTVGCQPEEPSHVDQFLGQRCHLQIRQYCHGESEPLLDNDGSLRWSTHKPSAAAAASNQPNTLASAALPVEALVFSNALSITKHSTNRPSATGISIRHAISTIRSAFRVARRVSLFLGLLVIPSIPISGGFNASMVAHASSLSPPMLPLASLVYSNYDAVYLRLFAPPHPLPPAVHWLVHPRLALAT